MKRILESAAIAGLAAACLSTAACDSKGTKEVKQEAKAIDSSYQAQADLVEATGKNAPDNTASEQEADALRNQGDAIKDHLNKEAEATQRDTRKQ